MEKEVSDFLFCYWIFIDFFVFLLDEIYSLTLASSLPTLPFEVRFSVFFCLGNLLIDDFCFRFSDSF